MASGLLDKANIILTPTGYKAGTMYNVAPIEQPYEDFDFARASVASRVNSSGLVEMVGRTLGSNLVQNGDFSELGSELVTNGDFSNGLTGWNNNATFPVDNLSVVNNRLELENITGSTQVFTSDTFNVTSGKSYKISLDTIKESGVDDFDISLRTTALGTVVETITTTQQTGTLTYYFTSSSTQNILFQFTLRDTIKGSIDNVSVKQLDPNDYWTLGAGWSIGDEEAICNGVGINSLQQSGITTTGKTYKLIFDVISKSNDDFLVISTNFGDTYVNGSSTIVGTNTFYINPSGGTGIRFRVANGTSLTITNITVQEIIDTNNIPRINYDSNGENGHWLLEPTSTNLLPYSEDFTQSNWIKHTDIVLTPNQTSPDGSNNAYKVQGTIGSSYILDAGFSAITTQSRSVYMKADTNGVVYSLGDNQSHQINVTTEWQRFELQEVSNSIYAVDFRGSGVTLDTVYIWAAQLEALPYATSYIPTLTGSTETRAAETATGAGSADLINSTEGVLYAEINSLSYPTDVNSWLTITDGTANNSVGIVFETTPLITGRVEVGGVNQAYLANNVDYSNFVKVAVKYKANDFALWINGVEVATDTSGNTFSANTLNSLQFSYGGGTNNWKGKVKALTVFNTALTDAELTELTS